ncbi:arylsulfatase L-like isoform X6 [Dipodomys merriami]|uniref:arylsulfatase L-like isoform X6 n=1 Tax=Dipodomys merriami TaxID=94247 RepID=UPI003855BF57
MSPSSMSTHLDVASGTRMSLILGPLRGQDPDVDWGTRMSPISRSTEGPGPGCCMGNPDVMKRGASWEGRDPGRHVGRTAAVQPHPSPSSSSSSSLLAPAQASPPRAPTSCCSWPTTWAWATWAASGTAACGMVTTNGARVLQWAAVSGGLPTSEITFAKILQEQGYATGLIGVFIVHADCFLMRDHQVVQQPLRFEASAGLFLREAEAFIHRHQARPFLLLVSFLHVHVPLVTSPAFRGRSAHGAYGDNVEELDWMVGQLLAALDGAGLGRRTLVYFTSDHGASLEARAGGARLGGSNGVHRGGKGMGGWEGGIRVPGLVRWPGMLPAGRLVPEPTSLMDLFPTVVRLAGGWVPADREVDGRDLMPALLGTAQATGHDFLLHYCEARLHAVRWFDRPSRTVWKLHFATPRFDPPGSGACLGFPACACSGRRMTRHRRPLLFDLTADPGETRPLRGPMATRRRVEAAVARMLRTRRPRAAPPLAPAHNTWSPHLQPCCAPGLLCACDRLIPDL